MRILLSSLGFLGLRPAIIRGVLLGPFVEKSIIRSLTLVACSLDAEDEGSSDDIGGFFWTDCCWLADCDGGLVSAMLFVLFVIEFAAAENTNEFDAVRLFDELLLFIALFACFICLSNADST